MDEFKQKLQVRNTWLAISMVVFALIYFILYSLSNRLPEIPDFFKGYQSGFFTGGELFLAGLIVRNLLAMRSPEKLKMLYIKETDERTAAIRQNSGALSFSIIAIGLSAAIIASGFFNETVFFTLLATLFSIAFVMLALQFYFKWKLG